MSGIVMAFGLKQEKALAVREICRKLKIKYKDVSVGDYAQKMGYIAEVDGFMRQRATYSESAFPKEMLVFSGMDSDMLDKFLDAYKSCGLAAVDLKAVITVHNIGWTPRQLFEELLKEHIQAADRLRGKH